MSHLDCPVYWQASQTLNTARQLAGRLRRLRQGLKACRRCLMAQSCPAAQNFNRQLEDVLTEIAEEWRLGEIL